MIAIHTIDAVKFENDIMVLQIDGKEVKVSLDKVSKKLLKANQLQRTEYKVSPSGYGIHWPMIDEDLAIEALLKEAMG